MQQLVSIYHDTLFQMLLCVQKAYEYLDQTTCMEVLRGYVLGEKKDNNTTVSGRPGSYTKCRMLIQPTVKDRERSDPGGTGII